MGGERVSGGHNKRGLTRKKGKKGPSAAEEQRIELTRLRYHVEEAEKRLQEQTKTAAHLREVHLQKTSEYDALQKDADRLAGDYQRQVEYLEEELMTKEENQIHRIKMLETELKRVTNELDCCRTFEEENKTLKQTMRELREEIDAKEVANADELFKQKKEAYRQQTMMEQELQRMVREMEDKYRAQAFAALDEESRNAIVAKGQLELKFLRQDETVQAMNERFDQIETANQHLKLDLDLTADRYDQQAVEAQKQKQQLQDAIEHGYKLERDMRLLSLELQKATAKGSQVEEMKKKMKASDRKAAKWKRRAMDIAKLSAQTPHGTFDKGGLHGAFGAPAHDSDSDFDENLGGDDDQDDEDGDEDLRSIWHAAFAPVKTAKRRGVSSAPGGSRATGNKGTANKSQARSSTSMGLRRSGSRAGGGSGGNPFANFSVQGLPARAESAASRSTQSSGMGMLPSVPNHVRQNNNFTTAL